MELDDLSGPSNKTWDSVNALRGARARASAWSTVQPSWPEHSSSGTRGSQLELDPCQGCSNNSSKTEPAGARNLPSSSTQTREKPQQQGNQNAVNSGSSVSTT